MLFFHLAKGKEKQLAKGPRHDKSEVFPSQPHGSSGNL
jgi:hypothetical protein